MADYYRGVLAVRVARMLGNSVNESDCAGAALAKCHRETLAEMEALAPKPQEESGLARLRSENRKRGWGTQSRPRGAC